MRPSPRRSRPATSRSRAWAMRYAWSTTDDRRPTTEAARVRSSVVLADAFQLPFRDDAFEAVVTLRLLFHYAEVEPIVREMARVCKPGGVVIFDTASWSPRARVALGLRARGARPRARRRCAVGSCSRFRSPSRRAARRASSTWQTMRRNARAAPGRARCRCAVPWRVQRWQIPRCRPAVGKRGASGLMS